MNALDLIYDELKKGTTFGRPMADNFGGTIFWTNLYIHNGYIQWRHYGESANKDSKENLRWIIREIFRMTPEQFLFYFMTYEDWKKIDDCYKEKKNDI